MEQLFRIHDKSPEGAQVGNYLQIGVLGYADDAALVSLSGKQMSHRLTKVSKGSREDADMSTHLDKTKNMIVERQLKIKPPAVADILETEAEF